MVPDQHAAVIVFANRQSHLTRTVDAAVDAVLGLGPKPAPKPAEPIALTPDEIAVYVGRYLQGQGGAQEVVRTDSGGITLRTGRTLLPLTKIGADAFTVQFPGFTDPIRVEFVRGPDGHVLFLHNRLRAQKRVR